MPNLYPPENSISDIETLFTFSSFMAYIRSASPFSVVSCPTRDTFAGTFIVSSNMISFTVIFTVCSLQFCRNTFNSDALVPLKSTVSSNAILSSITFKEVLYSSFQLYSGVKISFVLIPKASVLFSTCKLCVIFLLSSSDIRSNSGNAYLIMISSLSVSLISTSSDAT